MQSLKQLKEQARQREATYVVNPDQANCLMAAHPARVNPTQN